MLNPMPNIDFYKRGCHLDDASAFILQKNEVPIKLSSLRFVLETVSLLWRASSTLFKQQLSDKDEKVSDFSINTTAYSDVC